VWDSNAIAVPIPKKLFRYGEYGDFCWSKEIQSSTEQLLWATQARRKFMAAQELLS
jgi:hypothetical protein